MVRDWWVDTGSGLTVFLVSKLGDPGLGQGR